MEAVEQGISAFLFSTNPSRNSNCATFLRISVGATSMEKSVNVSARDQRLDFFRGLSLFFIFVDHIPENLLSYGTLHNFAFCDAAEVFIFISGFTAALVYGRRLDQQGAVIATAQIYRRVWQLYVAHIFILVVFIAEVSYAVSAVDNPMYNEELRVGDFLEQPHIAIVEALLLRFQPPFLDILPLYIILLSVFPAILMAISRHPAVVLTVSGALYGVTRWREWTVPGYPPQHDWFFNPLAWQFLFVIGAVCGHRSMRGRPVLPDSKWLTPTAVAIVLAGAAISMSWSLNSVSDAVPALFLKPLYPYASDKSNLAPLRLINFLALAIMTVHLVRSDAAFLRWPALRPIILCGQYSLQVFCLGILLSVTGHFVVSELLSDLAGQVLVNLVGIMLMIGAAWVLNWYKGMQATAARG